MARMEASLLPKGRPMVRSPIRTSARLKKQMALNVRLSKRKMRMANFSLKRRRPGLTASKMLSASREMAPSRKRKLLETAQRK